MPLDGAKDGHFFSKAKLVRPACWVFHCQNGPVQLQPASKYEDEKYCYNWKDCENFVKNEDA